MGTINATIVSREEFVEQKMCWMQKKLYVIVIV